jgi:hypothetical protein
MHLRRAGTDATRIPRALCAGLIVAVGCRAGVLRDKGGAARTLRQSGRNGSGSVPEAFDQCAHARAAWFLGRVLFGGAQRAHAALVRAGALKEAGSVYGVVPSPEKQ